MWSALTNCSMVAWLHPVTVATALTAAAASDTVIKGVVAAGVRCIGPALHCKALTSAKPLLSISSNVSGRLSHECKQKDGYRHIICRAAWADRLYVNIYIYIYIFVFLLFFFRKLSARLPSPTPSCSWDTWARCSGLDSSHGLCD